MVVLKKYPSSINGGEMEDDEEFDTMVSDSESDLESESDGEEKDDIKLTEPSKTAINNKEGLLEKLSEISWPKDADWIHSLSVVIDQDQEVDVNDDLAREAAFYTQALQGTREAFAKLESKGLPYLRPFDYYAEMVKTDAHMGKVQAEKQKDRAKEKKESIESVKKWRKQRERSGYANDKDEMKLSFEEGGGGAKGKRRGPPGVSPGDRSGGKAGKFGKGQKGMDKKRKSRDFKDSKFGFGGRKGGKKQNTAETTNDFKGFNKESRFGNKKRKQF
uniref:rRNA processing protein EBP2 n=1 Tax=Chenopodium quinoa TaxID=63459 RepID=A0A803KMY7_CHEQI